MPWRWQKLLIISQHYRSMWSNLWTAQKRKIAHSGLLLHINLLIVYSSLWQHVDSPWTPWWNDPKCLQVSIPFYHGIDPCVSGQSVSLWVVFVKQASLQRPISQKGREVRREEGVRWGGGRTRMGGMIEGAQSIYGVTVCSGMLEKIYHKWTGASLWTSWELLVLTKCKTALLKSKSRKYLTGRDKETVKFRGKNKRESGSTLGRWTGIPKGHNWDTHSDGGDEETAWGTGIMWGELNVSAGGFTAGSTGTWIRRSHWARCCRHKIYSAAMSPGNDWTDR